MDGSNGGRKKGSMNEEWFLSVWLDQEGCMWVCTGKCVYVNTNFHKYCNGILSNPEINIPQENPKRSKLKITKEEMRKNRI